MGSWGKRDLEEIAKVVKHLEIANERLLDLVFSARETPSVRQMYKMRAVVGLLANEDHSNLFSPEKPAQYAAMVADALVLEDEIYQEKERERARAEKDAQKVVEIVSSE